MPLALATAVMALAGLLYSQRRRPTTPSASGADKPSPLRASRTVDGVREARQSLLEGRLLLARGQIPAAMAALNKAAQHGPELAGQAVPMLLVATLREGDLDAARALWARTDLRACPTSVLVDMAQELERVAMGTEARAVYDVILARNPVLQRAAAQVSRLAPAQILRAEEQSGEHELAAALPERYTEVTLLDRGGMGVIYRARDRKLGRPVAIKTLSPALRGSVQACKRFVAEARALARLAHPAIPAIHDVGQGAVPYIVMDLLTGEDLETVLHREGALDVGRVMRVARQVLDALAHAHSRKILHRDIKPGNIIVDADNSVKLVDFGIARIMDATSLTTQTSGMLGTVSYIAPEQINGEEVSERTDLYSFGATLFHLLTGRLPFPDNPVAGHAHGTPPAPSSLRAQIPQWIDRIILSCMEKDPARRPASAQDLLHAMGVAGEPLTLQEGYALAAELTQLQTDTLHGIVNGLSKARRFAGDGRGFADSFLAADFQKALQDRFEGPQGVIIRLDHLASRWLVAPDLLPESLRPPARILGLLGQGRSSLWECLSTLQSLSTREGTPDEALEALQARIVAHLDSIARLTRDFKSALDDLHLPVQPLLAALPGRYPGTVVLRPTMSPELTIAVLDKARTSRELASTLDQLVDNALQAGAHRVDVTAVQDAPGGFVELTLSDDGKGMSPAQIEEAFVRPFTTRADGTGTGLMAAARVVADLRGRIAASPAAGGRGLTVRLSLPTVF